MSSYDALTTAQPNADRAFLAAADVFEGFGGFYYDQDGTPTVYLKNPETSGAIDGQLRAMFLAGAAGSEANTAPNGPAIRYRAGNYDFKELVGFGAVAGRLLDRESSAVSLDIDEVNNRITLAVSDDAARQRLEEVIRASCVPSDAFVVNFGERASPTVGPGDSLDTKFNPIPGGVITRDTSFCTLGITLN